MKRIGEFVREKRKEKGLSIRKVCERSGVSTAEISRIETGIRPTSTIQILEKIVNALGVGFDEFLRETGYINDDPAMRLVEEEVSKFPDLKICEETKLRLAEVIREHLRTDMSILSERKAG